MRGASAIWSCSSCVGLVLAALLGTEVVVSASGSGYEYEYAEMERREDLVHRIPKAPQITPAPQLLQRRQEGGSCKTDYTMCPMSVNGGCCPTNYECATDSCFATTQGPTTACGMSGYFACGVADSGGCCPVGYICGSTACEAPKSHVTTTYTNCPNDFYLCPAQFNFGCCRSGMGCAVDACYSTESATTTIKQTVTTTDDDGETITTTKTSITFASPLAPTIFDINDSMMSPKFIPTSIPKESAESTPKDEDSGGGGLSGAQLGGIVGGVVALLLVVVVAAFIIIRRLNKVQDVVESRKGGSSAGYGQSKKTPSQAQMSAAHHYGRHLHSDMDSVSVDPLMITSGTNPNSVAGTPQPDATGPQGRYRADSDALSPMQNGYPASNSPSVADGIGNVNPRHASMDSYQGNGGYFDMLAGPNGVPQPMSRAAIRGSTDSYTSQGQQQYSHYAYHHWRQQSNASELSADGSEGAPGVGSPLVGVPELDASGVYVELPSAEPQTAVGGTRSRGSSFTVSPRVSLSAARRRSESVNSNLNGNNSNNANGTGNSLIPHPPRAGGHGGAIIGPDGLAAFAPLSSAPLGVVSEHPPATEVPLPSTSHSMHGFYGAGNRQVGQTAVGLPHQQQQPPQPWDVGSIPTGTYPPALILEDDSSQSGSRSHSPLPPPPPPPGPATTGM